MLIIELKVARSIGRMTLQRVVEGSLAQDIVRPGLLGNDNETDFIAHVRQYKSELEEQGHAVAYSGPPYL